MLFLIDEAHGYYGIPEWTRRQPPKCRRVSSRCPSRREFGINRRKETAALKKIKAAAIE